MVERIGAGANWLRHVRCLACRQVQQGFGGFARQMLH